MSIPPKLQKGIHAVKKGDLKRAAEMFRAVLKGDPENSDALNMMGMVQHQLGKSKQALALIHRSLALDPINALAFNNLGNVLKETGQGEEALKAFRNALKHDPLNVQCLNNVAVMLRNGGKYDAAVSTLKQAIQIAPEMSELYHNLGVTYAAAEDPASAVDAFLEGLNVAGDWVSPGMIVQIFVGRGLLANAERLLLAYLEKHPNNATVEHQLAAVRGENIERASDEYVTTVFDGFAASFDATLEGLDYRAPQLVTDAVAAQLGTPKADLTMLDLGCGTGLCGPLIQPYKSQLVGIDLSPGMMRRAELRGCYDKLRKAELQSYLETQPPSSVDVAICADTLVYLGALERTFAGVYQILKTGGLFVTTVEAAVDDAEHDHSVDSTGRFKHKKSYLERLSKENELKVLSLEAVELRKELGAPVIGYVLTAVKP